MDADVFAELAEAARKGQGPPRKAGARAVRPRESATVLLIRRDGPAPRVLMGRRSRGHSFMPDFWVFPGGRLDRIDARAPAATELAPEVAATFDAHLRPGRGRALGLAAIRETFEETGLLLARPAPPRPGLGSWRDFYAQGALPDLGALDILSRAITPPMVGKRFDTWFLLADAERLIDLKPRSGRELEELDWLDFEDAMARPIPFITRAMLKVAQQRLDDPDRPRPFTHMRHGRLRLDSL